MKKTNVKIISVIWILLMISSFFVSNVKALDEPQFDEQASLIDSWLKADVIAIDSLDNEANKGTDQVTSSGKNFRVIIGGYRLDSINDLGFLDLDDDGIQDAKYKRYNIRFQVLVRTISTSQEVIGNVYESSATETYARLYGRQFWYEDYELLKDAKAVIPYLRIPTDWRQNAEQETKATVLIRLSMNPQFDIQQTFSNDGGVWKFSGLWAGFSDVRTKNPSSDLQADIISKNIQVLTQLGGEAEVEQTPSDQLDQGSQISSNIDEANVYLQLARYIKGENLPEDTLQVGAIVDKIYNSPNNPLDMFQLDQSHLNYEFDKSITNINNTRIYFPYNIRLRPQTQILQVKHYLHKEDVYINTGTVFYSFDSHVPNSGYTRTLNTGYRISDVYQIQDLIGSVDIVSKYDFTPTITDRDDLVIPEEFQTNDSFSGLPIGYGGEIIYEQPIFDFGDLFGNIAGQFLDIILIIGLVIVIGVATYFLIRFAINRSKKNR